jgi:hypothetical protein
MESGPASDRVVNRPGVSSEGFTEEANDLQVASSTPFISTIAHFVPASLGLSGQIEIPDILPP